MIFSEKIDKEDYLSNNLSCYAKNNGLRLLKNKTNWSLFDKDELKVEIKFIEKNNKQKIEYKAPLFEELSYSLEIVIRPICGEKFIRDIAKTDLIGKCGNKIYLIRQTNIKENLYRSKAIDYEINSMIRKSKKLQEEISALLDNVMFAKLN